MQPVGFPSIAWIPPYVAQVPAATTAQAFGTSRSIQSQVVIGCPVVSSVPNDAQYPSCLFLSYGIDPPKKIRKGVCMTRALALKNFTNSSPFFRDGAAGK